MAEPVTDWWADHDNIVALAHWMAEHGHTANEVAYMVEKPWKHDDLWTEMKEEDDE